MEALKSLHGVQTSYKKAKNEEQSIIRGILGRYVKIKDKKVPSKDSWVSSQNLRTQTVGRKDVCWNGVNHNTKKQLNSCSKTLKASY